MYRGEKMQFHIKIILSRNFSQFFIIFYINVVIVWKYANRCKHGKVKLIQNVQFLQVASQQFAHSVPWR